MISRIPSRRGANSLSLHVPSWFGLCLLSMLEELCSLPPSPKGVRHTQALQTSTGCLRHPKASCHHYKVVMPCPISHARQAIHSQILIRATEQAMYHHSLPCAAMRCHSLLCVAMPCHVLAQQDHGIAPMITHRYAWALSAPCKQSISVACTIRSASRPRCLPSNPTPDLTSDPTCTSVRHRPRASVREETTCICLQGILYAIAYLGQG